MEMNNKLRGLGFIEDWHFDTDRAELVNTVAISRDEIFNSELNMVNNVTRIVEIPECYDNPADTTQILGDARRKMLIDSYSKIGWDSVFVHRFRYGEVEYIHDTGNKVIPMTMDGIEVE